MKLQYFRNSEELKVYFILKLGSPDFNSTKTHLKNLKGLVVTAVAEEKKIGNFFLKQTSACVTAEVS